MREEYFQEIAIRESINKMVRHFKGDKYLIDSISKHTEREEELVNYRELYGECELHSRPMSMFIEKCNKEQLAQYGQVFRFMPYHVDSVNVDKPIECTIHELATLNSYKYVVIIAKYRGKFVICRHKDRKTWELPGGHIEKDEMLFDAAKRELYEETGANLYTMKPIFDYGANGAGAVFYAEIEGFADLPKFEMAEIQFVDSIKAEELTYPTIYAELFKEFDRRITE